MADDKKYVVDASFTVEVTNPTVVAAIGGGGDELAQVQAAANAGLKELQSIAGRYGFTITGSTANVRSAS